MKKNKILLIEDNRVLREGIAVLLKKHSDFQVMAWFGTNESIMEKIRTFKPSVVLLDLGLRNLNSLALLKNIKASADVTKVVAMDLIPTHEDVLEFVRAGVSGFIVKDATIEDFVGTIRSVADGRHDHGIPLVQTFIAKISARRFGRSPV